MKEIRQKRILWRKQDAAYFAEFYKKDKIRGGHIILLNPSDSSYYKETKRQALLALHTYPGGMQVGGGIHAEKCQRIYRGRSQSCN